MFGDHPTKTPGIGNDLDGFECSSDLVILGGHTFSAV
jgi:hypothetical protein